MKQLNHTLHGWQNYLDSNRRQGLGHLREGVSGIATRVRPPPDTEADECGEGDLNPKRKRK